jgi:integrative and conjugative element protein (TIGR02256 family)
MTFLRPKGGRVWLSEAVVPALTSCRQLGPDSPEVGGVVLGRLILDSQDIVIDEITLPTAHDRGRTLSFFRSRGRTQRRINEAWRESHGTRIYLGEWHTHPQDNPEPSAQDLRNWHRVAGLGVFEQESLLFLIVGRRNVRAWELLRGAEPREADSLDFDQPPLGCVSRPEP